MADWGENPCKDIEMPQRHPVRGQQCLVNPLDYSRVVAHIGKIFISIILDFESRYGRDDACRSFVDGLRQGFADRVIPDREVPVNYLRFVGDEVPGLFEEQALNAYFVAIEDIAKLDTDADKFREQLLNNFYRMEPR